VRRILVLLHSGSFAERNVVGTRRFELLLS
jgi:hypothetical protein